MDCIQMIYPLNHSGLLGDNKSLKFAFLSVISIKFNEKFSLKVLVF